MTQPLPARIDAIRLGPGAAPHDEEFAVLGIVGIGFATHVEMDGRKAMPRTGQLERGPVDQRQIGIGMDSHDSYLQ
ncbi:hypothetical protein PT2222_160232 [Paraburkholderia tropica]